MSILDASSFQLREVGRKVEFPLLHSPEHKVVTCSMMGCTSQYAKLPLSTPWEHDVTLVLVDEKITKVHNDYIWFDRVWANIPNPWNDASTMAFQFPGFYSPLGDVLRRPFSISVPVRIQHDYYLTELPFEDIPLSNVFQVTTIGDNGYGTQPTEYVGGAISIPSLFGYLTDISNKKEIVGADSTIEQYMGNIWVRKNFLIVCR